MCIRFCHQLEKLKQKQTEKHFHDFQLPLKQKPKSFKWSSRPRLDLAPDLSGFVTHHTRLCTPATQDFSFAGMDRAPCTPRAYAHAAASSQNPLLLTCHFLRYAFSVLCD